MHMMGLRGFIALCFVFFSCTNTYAALGIEEAVRTCLANNPTAREAREKLEETHSRVPLAWSQLLPAVSATAEADYKKDSLLIPNPLFGGEPYNYYTVGLQFIQPLFRGGGLLSGLRYTKKDNAIQELNLKITERDLTLKVLQSFYSILFGQKRLEAMTEIETIQRNFMKDTEYRYRIGREQKITILQVRTDLAMLEPKIVQAKNDLKIAAAELATLLGEVDHSEISVQGDLNAPNWEELAKQVKEHAVTPYELQRDQTTRDQFEDQKDVTLSKHWPQLSAIGSINTSATAKSRLFDQDGRFWVIGLQLSIPLFSGLSSFSERHVLAAQGAQLEVKEAQTRDQLTLSQIRTRHDLELSQTLVEASKTALTHAREASDYAIRNYRLSVVNYQQFYDSQKTLLDAELTYHQARYDYIIHMAQYFIAEGWPIDDLVRALQHS